MTYLMSTRCATFIIVLLLSIGSSSVFAQTAEQEQGQESKKPSIPLEDIATFADVFNRIKNEYVEPLSDEELLRYAIRGMAEELDPYSTYLDSKQYGYVREDTQGKFGGLGVRITHNRSGLAVISPIDNTPATDADIRAGDIIIQVDGKRLSGLKRKESIDLLRGEVGSKVSISLIREGEEKPLKKELIREFIQQKTISSTWLKKDVAYIRISQFQAATAGDFRDALFNFQADSERELAGLVVDLRNNPGGLLNSAISISDVFLKQGTIVSTKSRKKNADRKYAATAKDFSKGIPLVVLINGASASAAEIVAGALQDNQRATIFGEQSYGKGSVQSVINLGDNSALKLTTAKYYTPNGRSIDSIGIMPDVIIEAGKFVPPITRDTRAARQNKGQEHDELLERDQQLRKAVEFLQEAI